MAARNPSKEYNETSEIFVYKEIKYPIYKDNYGSKFVALPCEVCGRYRPVMIRFNVPKNTKCIQCSNQDTERAAKIGLGITGIKRSEETKEKVRQANLGKHLTEETKIKMSVSTKGRAPWNKGVHLSEEDKLHKSIAQKLVPHTEEWNKKVGESQIGKIVSEESKKKMSLTHTGVPLEESRKLHMSQTHKKRWENEEFKNEQLRLMKIGCTVRPTIPEAKVEALLNFYCPNEYKYTGNGEVVIGCFNPDFININGQKKVIEVFGDYWHGKEFRGISKEEEENNRISYFAKYGFSCLVIWGHELKDGNPTFKTIEKIKVFNEIK